LFQQCDVIFEPPKQTVSSPSVIAPTWCVNQKWDREEQPHKTYSNVSASKSGVNSMCGQEGLMRKRRRTRLVRPNIASKPDLVLSNFLINKYGVN